MEKILQKRSLRQFSKRSRDWSDQSYRDRLDAMAEIGREPRKIQVLTAIDGVSFEEAFANHTEVAYDGILLKFIGKEELIRNKLASGRGKDLIDADELKKN